jgi:hypothetical protein
LVIDGAHRFKPPTTQEDARFCEISAARELRLRAAGSLRFGRDRGLRRIKR